MADNITISTELGTKNTKMPPDTNYINDTQEQLMKRLGMKMPTTWAIAHNVLNEDIAKQTKQ